MKKIITHTNPDLDAVTSVWLLKRFLPGWEEAEVEFVFASDSIKAQKEIDLDPEVLWVDVGRGQLDHHQTDAYLCATKLTFDFIKRKRKGQPLGEIKQEALKEIVKVVTQVDNARDLNWEEVNKSRYYFQLHTLIDGLRGLAESDEQALEFSLRALDAILWNLRSKIRAEKELENGFEFQTPWGKAIAVESGDKHVLWVGEIQGFVLVIKKDPEKGGVRMYARPDSEVDLTEAHRQFKKMDPESDWFLHATKRMLLNDSTINPNMRPTKLSLQQVIATLKKT
ncbi:chromate resistance protein ChrB domain-containing protein [Patescibacteria group bacterium]